MTSGLTGRGSQREEGDPPVRLAADVLRVAGDPQTLRCRQEIHTTHPPDLARVPVAGQSGARVDGADALPWDRARPGAVLTQRVVQPAVVALHVDGSAGDHDGVQGV